MGRTRNPTTAWSFLQPPAASTRSGINRTGVRTVGPGEPDPQEAGPSQRPAVYRGGYSGQQITFINRALASRRARGLPIHRRPRPANQTTIRLQPADPFAEELPGEPYDPPADPFEEDIPEEVDLVSQDETEEEPEAPEAPPLLPTTNTNLWLVSVQLTPHLGVGPARTREQAMDLAERLVQVMRQA